MDTQLIAHDREVYDIAWGGVAIFATVSADGSVRVFDLRCAPGGGGARLWRPVCTARSALSSTQEGMQTSSPLSPPPQRDKEHSTIIYESPRPDTPLLRLSWNKQARGGARGRALHAARGGARRAAARPLIPFETG